MGRDLVDIAAILMCAGADPNAENGDAMSETEEEGEGESKEKSKEEKKEESKEGNTAFDLAIGNEKVSNIRFPLPIY